MTFRKLLSPAAISLDWAALLLRAAFCGLMVFNHGITQMTLFSETPEIFPDPLGIGGKTSYYLAVFAEGICAVLVLFGLFTRLTLVPLMVTMIVAVLGIHWFNPLTDKELPLLYFTVYLATFLLGPGRFSLDAVLFEKINSRD